jgi:hypothetical protein
MKSIIPKLKKISSFFVTILCFSCMNDLGLNEEPAFLKTNDRLPTASVQQVPLPDMRAFREILNSRVDNSFVVTQRYAATYQTAVYFNHDRATRDELATMTSYIRVANIEPYAFADLVGSQPNAPIGVRPSGVAGASTLYTSTQLSILDNYFGKMYSATTLDYVSRTYTDIMTTIANSTTLIGEDRVEVLAVIEVANEYAKDYFAGSYINVYNDLRAAGITPGPASIIPMTNNLGFAQTANVIGCNVNFRSIWAGAIVGGVVGGARGAIIGATGGTVAFPGLGTVSGAVGGGVVGFATGFIEGTLTGVAAELLTTCFRKAEITQPELLTEDNFNQLIPCPNGDCTSEFRDLKNWYDNYL